METCDKKWKGMIIIPALNPDDKMIELIKDLKQKGFNDILLVNDGSKLEYEKYFRKAQEKYDCNVIANFRNLGKGRALKYAFNYVLTNFPEIEAVVTVDCDGQHKPDDVAKLIQKSKETKETDLILGVRKFDKKVPLKSSFGNKMTRSTMNIFCGVKVSDANTGLRLFTRTVMEKFLDTSGERFSYEINMLLETKEKEIGIVEVPIETIYYENNKSTHFRPIVDSVRIYSLFLKYILASVLSFAIDFGVFAIMCALTKSITAAWYIMISTIIARVVSSLFNYVVNRKTVFKSKKSTRAMIMYFSLVVINMFISGTCVDLFVKHLLFNEILAKIIVDGVLFILNFIIQREFIFKNKKAGV